MSDQIAILCTYLTGILIATRMLAKMEVARGSVTTSTIHIRTGSQH